MGSNRTPIQTENGTPQRPHDVESVEPDTKGKPGAGAGPVGVPDDPEEESPDVDAGSQ